MTRRVSILTGLAAAGLCLAVSFAASAQSAGDPPDQVGRLAQTSGTVSFHTAGDNQWSPATLNYPITNGNSLWTEPRSHAAVDVGSSRVYMDSSTELDVGTIDDQHFVASVPQGAVYARVGAGGVSQYEIDTPRGQVQIGQPGSYEVVAGDADHPTMVTVYEGLAQVVGPGENLSVGPGQSASISGEQNQPQVSTGQAPQPDDFIQFVQDEERPYANQQAQQSQPPQQQYGSPGMTGYQDLGQYGAWQSTPQYGPVWYPQVSSGWAPYRYGHWAYVYPWGWTWVDDAPWGFAPFHYGRWVDYGGRWGWVPGAYEAQPVYSPALVAFFGNFGGISIGIAIGQAVGWVPLGPGEVCYPGYRASPDYMRRMNVAYIHNTTIINYNYYNSPHGSDYNQYKNHQRGATMVSGDAMVHSRAIGQAWKQLPQGSSSASWQHAKSYGGQAPIKPAYTTAGVTSGTAHQIGLTGTGAPVVKHSPGPQIHQHNQFGATGQGANNAQGQNGQNNLSGTGHGATTFSAPSNNGTKIKGAGSPGPTIPNNGTGSGNNAQVNKGTVAPGPAITTNNGNGTQTGQTGGNPSNKPKVYNSQNGATGNATVQGNTTHQNLGTGQSNHTGTQGGQTGTYNANGNTGQQHNNQQNEQLQSGGQQQHNFNGTGANGTVHSNGGTGQQQLNQQNGQFQSGGQQQHNFNAAGTNGAGNSHNVQSGTAPKPPPPASSKCKAGEKCS